MTGRRRTFSTKTKAFTAVLTTAAAVGIAIPVIMSAQGEPATSANAGTARTPLSSVQKLHPDAACYEVRVPVSVKKLGNARIYGELCQPRHQSTTGKTVQLLVPGSTYNHSYYDMPVANGRYSYVSSALDAGFSTFNIDRLATGKSTLPPSSQYTLDTGTDTLHQVITQLRNGQIKDRTFDKVVWVGHSLGSSMAWAQAAQHPHDVDAFVLTSMSHVIRKEEPSDNDRGQDIQFEIKAKNDPKFRGTINDPGYLTTNVGMRQFFYDTAHTDPAVIKAGRTPQGRQHRRRLRDHAPFPCQVPLPHHQSAHPPGHRRQGPVLHRRHLHPQDDAGQRTALLLRPGRPHIDRRAQQRPQRTTAQERTGDEHPDPELDQNHKLTGCSLSARVVGGVRTGSWWASLLAELHDRLRPRRSRRCSCAGAGESGVQPGGDPVEDHAQVPFEPPVAVVVETPGLLDQ
ncbi:pimeloyl-ACP methyl ester carboxylesterase [Streptomyces ambofaciens]